MISSKYRSRPFQGLYKSGSGTRQIYIDLRRFCKQVCFDSLSFCRCVSLYFAAVSLRNHRHSYRRSRRAIQPHIRGTMRTCSVCSPYTNASFQAVQDGVKHTRKARPVRVYNQRSAQSSYTASQDWKSANPGFDDIELDEDYYQSLGISEEELADQLAFLANDADPMGEDVGPEGLDKQQMGASSYLMDEGMNEATWGPQVELYHLCSSVYRACTDNKYKQHTCLSQHLQHHSL